VSEALRLDVTNGELRAGYLRFLGLATACAVPLIATPKLTAALFRLVLNEDSFSQIALIPFVSAFLIYQQRKKVFSRVSYGWTLAIALLFPASLLTAAASLNLWRLQPTNQADLLVFGVILFWLGAFALFFGNSAARQALFPLCFLFFCVPVPEPLLSRIILWLQNASAWATEIFFRLGGLPYLRRGLIFDLPGVAIQVAEECSGIRSSMALLMTTVLAAWLFLKTGWHRAVVIAVVLPLAIIKNGMRIATLSALAIYLDPSFLYGSLHHHGGIFFFLIALVPLGLLLLLFQKSEMAAAKTT
jgi:exosortase